MPCANAALRQQYIVCLGTLYLAESSGVVNEFGGLISLMSFCFSALE
jgi:hypothetical protein